MFDDKQRKRYLINLDLSFCQPNFNNITQHPDSSTEPKFLVSINKPLQK